MQVISLCVRLWRRVLLTYKRKHTAGSRVAPRHFPSLKNNVRLSNSFQTASPLTSVGITRQISEDRYGVSTHLGQSRSSPNQGNVHIAECCFLKSSDGPLGQIIQPHRDLQMKHVFLCLFFNKHSSHCNARSRARILNCTENLMKTVIKENSFFKK